jgi:hypothetical protein
VVLDIPFPYSLLQTNPGYAIANVTPGALSRVMGTFTESSGAGLVLSALAAAILSRVLDGKLNMAGFLVVLAALAMVRSSSAIAAVALTTGIMLLYYPIIRFPWYVRLYRLRRLTGLAAGVFIAVLILVWSPLRTSLASLTLDKTSSVSYFARTTRDLFSLKIALDTHGLGVGLGSNRTSSLLTSLVSNVGVAGLLVFLWMYFRLLSNAKGTAIWIKWAGVALFLDMAFATPDINTPFLWALLALVVRLGTSTFNLEDSYLPEQPQPSGQMLASGV